ncbi:hypothetical protein HQ563_11305 [bacterium]|nr:hypothetical protein [bacterium]
MILGNNAFFGFAHKPDDVGEQMQAYYTEEQIMAVMDEAAEHSITAVWTPCYDHWVRLWNRYCEKRGKLKISIGQPGHPSEKMKDGICAGMFPKDDPDKIEENATLMRRLSGWA